jgi:glycine/D-amino acid oxidase-like deaminating enzyme
MELTERHDLRGGDTPWEDGAPETIPSDELPGGIIDVAICGAGVMGAMLAERLSAAGLSIAVLDRRCPGRGSTAASTALVLWEADVPLTQLARDVGEEEAVRRWRRVHRAATGLWDRLEQAKITFEHQASQSLYLAGDVLDAEGLRAEAALRTRYHLPSTYLAADAVSERYGIAPRAAIVSTDSFTADPLRLTLTMLEAARQHRASVTYPADVLGLRAAADHVMLTSDRGDLRAHHVILATGYERLLFFCPAGFRLKSTYALATAPGTAPLWRGNPMIWEAADAYLYARADPDGRVIVGGGDENFLETSRRDALIVKKTDTLTSNLSKLVGKPVEPRERWAAVFGSSRDGLPAIGRVGDSGRIWLASGFGGNGITFAALAAELLTAELTGSPDPDLACFNPYRFDD